MENTQELKLYNINGITKLLENFFTHQEIDGIYIETTATLIPLEVIPDGFDKLSFKKILKKINDNLYIFLTKNNTLLIQKKDWIDKNNNIKLFVISQIDNEKDLITKNIKWTLYSCSIDVKGEEIFVNKEEKNTSNGCISFFNNFNAIIINKHVIFDKKINETINYNIFNNINCNIKNTYFNIRIPKISNVDISNELLKNGILNGKCSIISNTTITIDIYIENTYIDSFLITFNISNISTIYCNNVNIKIDAIQHNKIKQIDYNILKSSQDLILSYSYYNEKNDLLNILFKDIYVNKKTGQLCGIPTIFGIFNFKIIVSCENEKIKNNIILNIELKIQENLKNPDKILLFGANDLYKWSTTTYNNIIDGYYKQVELYKLPNWIDTKIITNNENKIVKIYKKLSDKIESYLIINNENKIFVQNKSMSLSINKVYICSDSNSFYKNDVNILQINWILKNSTQNSMQSNIEYLGELVKFNNFFINIYNLFLNKNIRNNQEIEINLFDNINYHNYNLNNVIQFKIDYSSTLPKGLTLDEINGKIKGKIEQEHYDKAFTSSVKILLLIDNILIENKYFYVTFNYFNLEKIESFLLNNESISKEIIDNKNKINKIINNLIKNSNLIENEKSKIININKNISTIKQNIRELNYQITLEKNIKKYKNIITIYRNGIKNQCYNVNRYSKILYKIENIINNDINNINNNTNDPNFIKNFYDLYKNSNILFKNILLIKKYMFDNSINNKNILNNILDNVHEIQDLLK